MSSEEFGLYISKKLPNEDLKIDDLNELLDIASNNPEEEIIKQNEEITIKRKNDVYTIEISPNTVILAKM